MPSTFTVVLTTEERLFIHAMLNAPKALRDQLAHEGPIEISYEDADVIRNFFLDEAVHNGFDNNYKMTSDGYLLDDIADKFFTS